MLDLAAGASMTALLSGILAAAAYGTVGADGLWSSSEPLLYARRPVAAAGGQPLLSYMDFVKERAHPLEEAPAAAAPAPARAAAAARNSAVKKLQQALLARFTLPGAPGAAFAPVLAALLERLARRSG